MSKQQAPSARDRAKAAETAGDFKGAYQILIAALKKDPKDARTLAQLVILLLRRLDKAQDALPSAQRLLRLAPKSALAHELAAEVHAHLRSFEAAGNHARLSLRYDKGDPDRLAVLAQVFQKCALFDEANTCIARALKIAPDHLTSRLAKTELLISEGDTKAARAIINEIFAEAPFNFQNLLNWGKLDKAQKEDPIYLHLRDRVLPMLRDNKDIRLQRVLKLLGKVEGDIGDYRQSFLHYTEAKQLKSSHHDPMAQGRFVAGLQAGVSKASYFGITGHPSEIPVLVVGMPRTGSTLLEQVLSSHPQIGGIGESDQLRRLASSVGFVPGDGSGFARIIRELPQAKALELAEIYLKNATGRSPGSLRIVDKNLHNFELLGFFARLFPKGRVLLALRDPMDNCVSCYLQPLGEFHSYTNTLRDLGQYYREFRQLTDHWEKVIPNKLMRISYEEMVANTEDKAREVISFLGLEWDPACLEFQKNKARVRTLSVAQVRQPIYQSSVKRWKRYDEFLDPLKEELKGFYPDGF